MMLPDGEALLRAIVDDPDDEVAVWAYADWLQEQGREVPALFARTLDRLDAAETLRRQLHAADELQRQLALAGVRGGDARLNRAHARLIVRECRLPRSAARPTWAPSGGLEDSHEKG